MASTQVNGKGFLYNSLLCNEPVAAILTYPQGEKEVVDAPSDEYTKNSANSDSVFCSRRMCLTSNIGAIRVERLRFIAVTHPPLGDQCTLKIRENKFIKQRVQQ